MEKRKFAVVSTEDEIMFLSENNKLNIKCAVCNEAYSSGGTIICDAAGTRTRLCQNCLLKMQSVLYEGRNKDCETRDFSVTKYDGVKSSSFSQDEKAEFLFSFANTRLYLTADELTMIFRQVCRFNKTHNKIMIREYRKQRKSAYKERLDKLKWEYFNEAAQAIEATGDIESAKKYFSINICEKDSSLNNIEKKKKKVKKSVKTINRMFDNKNPDSTYNIGSKINQLTKETKFIISRNFEPCECDCINHINYTEAKYVISTNNKKIPFSLTVCPTCLSNLKSVMEHAAHNTYYENGEIHITRALFQEDSNHCLFCTQNSGTNNRIHIRNIEFNCCDQHKTELLNTITCALE